MKSGDSFCYTDNIEVVAALAALDIQVLDDSPFFYRLVGGKEVTIWNLKDKSDDGEFSTGELIKAYGTKGWFEKNPHHPFTLAVHAIRNLKTYEGWIVQSIPYATFDLGEGRELHAKISSSEFDAAIAQGLKPI